MFRKVWIQIIDQLIKKKAKMSHDKLFKFKVDFFKYSNKKSKKRCEIFKELINFFWHNTVSLFACIKHRLQFVWCCCRTWVTWSWSETFATKYAITCCETKITRMSCFTTRPICTHCDTEFCHFSQQKDQKAKQTDCRQHHIHIGSIDILKRFNYDRTI